MKLKGEYEGAYRVQDYGVAEEIAGVRRLPLRRFNDDGGSMIELLRPAETLSEGLRDFEVAQINYSTLQPGAIKAFHIHRRQTDVWFVPPEDRVLLVLFDARDGAPAGVHVRWVLGDGRAELVRIPPGVAHGCRNLGGHAARIFYFTDRTFSPDPSRCDEGRLAWDALGAEVWELSRG